MLRKITLQPGINREGTDYSAEGGWYDCDKVRFRKGRPEKIGGWRLKNADTFYGVCRSMHNWTTLSRYDYLSLGTTSKAYIEYGSTYYDITPAYNYGISFMTNGLSLTGTSVEITKGDASIWSKGDAARISSPYVPSGVGATLDSGGPGEYVQVNAAPGTSEDGYDSLTVHRKFFNSAASTHSYNLVSSKGPTVQRIPPARVTFAPTTASGGTNGCIGVTDGSNKVLIRQDDHNCLVGDYVTFLKLGAAVSGSGLTNSDFLVSTGFRVTSSFDDDNYEIEIGTSASGPQTTTLSEDLDTSETQIEVAEITGFADGDYIKIDDEYIKIDALPTGLPNKFPTVIRGQFGSTAATHEEDATVSKVEFYLPDNIASLGTLTYLLHDINSGTATNVSSSGWGRTFYGSGEWDKGVSEGSASESEVGVRIWSLDNFGEDLVLSPSREEIYYWDVSEKSVDGIPYINPGTDTTGAGSTANVNTNVPMSPAMPLKTFGTIIDSGYSFRNEDANPPILPESHAPNNVTQTMVYPASKMIIAFGSSDYFQNFDPMTIRWSADLFPGSWDPNDRTNPGTSGYMTLGNGSKIIGAAQSKGEIVLWTDSAMYKMDWIGRLGYEFGFSEISTDISIVSRTATATAADAIYWMGDRNFYRYNGAIEILPCSVLNYVYSDMNYNQRELFFAASNSEFNEVTFFYCSGSSDDIDRYVTFNYLENLWTIGSMDRTAWSDSGIREKPHAASVSSSPLNTSVLYEQETGQDNEESAMTAYVESAYFDIGEGDNFSFIDRIIPDVRFESGGGVGMDVTIKKKDFPNDAEEVAPATSSVDSSTKQSYVRIRGRQALVRFESTGVGVKWRLGDTRIDVRADGRR
jgi:hypothetical protein